MNSRFFFFTTIIIKNLKISERSILMERSLVAWAFMYHVHFLGPKNSEDSASEEIVNKHPKKYFRQ